MRIVFVLKLKSRDCLCSPFDPSKKKTPLPFLCTVTNLTHDHLHSVPLTEVSAAAEFI